MHKRQDSPGTSGIAQAGFLIIMAVLIGLGACNPINTAPPVVEVTSTKTPYQPTPTSSVSITPTANNTHPVTPTPTTSNDCQRGEGWVQKGRFFSDNLQADFSYQIYLPPCYHHNTSQRFPVLYLLHGLSYTEDQWIRLGLPEKMDALIAEGRVAPFIVVLPREASFTPPQTSQFANALILELIPWVDDQYRTLADRPYRAIGGLSRGAAWAVRIGFIHYGSFGSVGVHSLALFEADGNRLDSWLAQARREELPLFFFDIGRRDPERQSAESFANQLDAHNIPHTWYLFNGDHSESYWSRHLETYLRWYARNW